MPSTSVGNNKIIKGSNKLSSLDDVKNRIAKSESNGDYKAYNKSGSGAYGKYQFKWKWHGDAIKKLTGVKDEKEFLNNPKAQEKYMQHLLQQNKSFVSKHINKIQENIPQLSFEDAMMLYHYQPKLITDIASGKITSLDYVPGNSEKNATIGRYLYGNKYKGKKTN